MIYRLILGFAEVTESLLFRVQNAVEQGEAAWSEAHSLYSELAGHPETEEPLKRVNEAAVLTLPDTQYLVHQQILLAHF